MIEINTIDDFYRLSPKERSSILRSLQTRIRLEDYLKKLNHKKKRHFKQSFWMNCPKCRGEAGFQVTPRDGRDIHPSQITRCIKKIWFDCSTFTNPETGEEEPYFLYAKEEIPPRLRMIFDLGHGVHDMMQRYGGKGAWGSKKTYFSEVPIDPDAKDDRGRSLLPLAEANWIRGAVDAIIQPYIVDVPNMGKVAIRLVHEYKSIRSSGFSRLKQPKSEHKWQATIYSKIFNIPVVVYLYMNKDNCQLVDFPVPFDAALWQTIQEKIDKTIFYSEEKVPPPWEETSAVLDPRECEECGYAHLCQPPQTKSKIAARR